MVGAVVVGCGTDEAVVALSEVACQLEDVAANPPFIIAKTRTAVPPETFLADQIENYYGVELIDNRLTNTPTFCDLFEMADEEATIEMLNRTCSLAQVEEAEPPTVGQEVCALQIRGFRIVNFRQGQLQAKGRNFAGTLWGLA